MKVKELKEVASKLFISENTGKTHLKNMLEKYDAKSMCELVYKVLKQNKDLLAMLLVVFQIFITFQNPEIELRRTNTASRIVKTAKKNKR